MSDLENLWDDVPVGPAPVSAILREGRAAARSSRRPWFRPVTALAAVGALGGAFFLGTSVSGPGSPLVDGSGGGGTGDQILAAYHGELRAAGSCEELLDYYIERGLDLVGPYGWGYGGNVTVDFNNGFIPDADMRRPVPLNTGAADGVVADQSFSSKAAPPAPLSQRAESSGTGTNVQEASVDEPDVVKTDGEYVYRVDDNVLTTYDVRGETVEELGEVKLPELYDAQILLSGQTVIAIGSGGADRDSTGPEGGGRTFTAVARIDVSDPDAPEVTDEATISAALVTARQHGDTIRLITSNGLPDLDFLGPGGRGGDESQEQATQFNRALVRETTLADWLPTATVGDGSAEQLADCGSVALPDSELGLDTVTVVGFDADAPTDWDVTTVAADASTTYASADHLYLASAPSGFFGGCFDCGFFPRGGFDDRAIKDQGITSVFDFELTDRGTTYVGSGEVKGSIRDRWAMDEADGVLRLAVSPTGQTENENSVVTFERRGQELEEIGRLDGIGKNEDIQSVRWFDGLAIVVTFRRIDPFYTIDLTDPKAPTMLGELKIPGFSSYLHPLGANQILGMGAKGNGAQAGLFSVQNLTDPRQKQVIEYGRSTFARAGEDPRQFTWLPGKRTVLTVIADYRANTGYISVLRLADGKMTNRMVEAPAGRVEKLRTLPLPDDRVVLVTGAGVEFFDLD
ncbi:hypothetical protein GCM10027020_27430 [Nocardioides salsibiostraticola]